MLQVIMFKEGHLEEAAKLVSNRYRNLRAQVPLLPGRYQEASSIMPLLENMLAAECPGVAAIQDGQLAGFMIAWLMPDFRGKRSTYSPEWANAARAENSGYIYERMYSKMAAGWVADQYVAHYISLFADQAEAIRAWHWLGFGMLGVDAVRGLQPLNSTNRGVEIQPAGLEHLEQVMALHEGLVGYARGSPDFYITENFNRQYFEAWLGDSDRVIWLAFENEVPVAFIRMGPANQDACGIIYDQKTTSIYGAFTQERVRGQDVGTALLAHAIDMAARAGYERCAVDFESMNVLGTRFWLRHDFKPVCFALNRCIDERVV